MQIVYVRSKKTGKKPAIRHSNPLLEGKLNTSVSQIKTDSSKKTKPQDPDPVEKIRIEIERITDYKSERITDYKRLEKISNVLLRKLTKDKIKQELRIRYLDLFWRIGHAAHGAIPYLVKRLYEKDEMIRESAVHSIYLISKNCKEKNVILEEFKEILPELVRILNSNKCGSMIRHKLIETLINLTDHGSERIIEEEIDEGNWNGKLLRDILETIEKEKNRRHSVIN